jgi:hypothetical protein
VISAADSFRSRATQCRNIANGTKDIEAQRELRALAKDLDDEADKIEREEIVNTNGDQSAVGRGSP